MIPLHCCTPFAYHEPHLFWNCFKFVFVLLSSAFIQTLYRKSNLSLTQRHAVLIFVLKMKMQSLNKKNKQKKKMRLFLCFKRLFPLQLLWILCATMIKRSIKVWNFDIRTILWMLLPYTLHAQVASTREKRWKSDSFLYKQETFLCIIILAYYNKFNCKVQQSSSTHALQ